MVVGVVPVAKLSKMSTPGKGERRQRSGGKGEAGEQEKGQQC